MAEVLHTRMPLEKLGATESTDKGEKIMPLTHGATVGPKKWPEYRTWVGMKTRCNNPLAKSWKNYGGRGIYICKRWLKFENFFSDMGHKPTPQHTIDRIDNDGPYSPENCRWATRKEQAQHKRIIPKEKRIAFARAAGLASRGKQPKSKPRKHIGPLMKNYWFFSKHPKYRKDEP